jgi:hypothetical protein
MLPETREKTAVLPSISTEDIPEWQIPMYTNLFESTERLISYVTKGQEVGFFKKQIESVFTDEGRGWWEDNSEIVPEDIICLIHGDMRVERPDIEEDIPLSERKELSLTDLENWFNVNKGVFEGLEV